MSDSNYSLTLLTAAQAYLALGYSVIPLHSDADRAKIAAIQWGTYQRTRPTDQQLHDWFVVQGFSALGIVTGRISRLFILDFDTTELFQSFSQQHPNLAQHHIIQTRRGYHIYYHLPPNLTIGSRRGQDIDLLSDGRYVVAHPSIIDGHTYKLIRGGQPKRLSLSDIHQITGFVDEQVSRVTVPVLQHELIPVSSNGDRLQPAVKLQANPKTPIDLQHIYRGEIEKGRGRNEALFQTSLKARDEGWSVEGTLAILADLHVWQPGSPSHRPEAQAGRYQETRKTVFSAFSRPAKRPALPVQPADELQLPNSVREKLFSLGETRAVRLLDGLRLTGINSGQTFTVKQALERLKGIVGRDSVYAALKARNTDGQPIFQEQNASPLTPPSTANAATNKKTPSNKCFIGRDEKPGKSPNHRPATVYIMPANDELCRRLGVKPSRSDPISLDDLATAKQTRMALQREFIKRRPGRYPRHWLARRLGVGKETLDTYNQEIPIHSRPCFWEQPIYWWNLNAVPDEIEVNGAVLEDETGKHYPPRREIAARLLGQGKQIIYKRQDANYYWYGETPPNLSIGISIHPQQPEMDARMAAIRAYASSTPPSRAVLPTPSQAVVHIPKMHPIPAVAPTSTLPNGEMVAPIAPANAVPHQVRKRHYRKPLPDQTAESCAQRVYTQIGQWAEDAKGQISQATARRLVDTYGVNLVGQGLAVIAQRKNIANPIGFLVTWLRSESRRQ